MPRPTQRDLRIRDAKAALRQQDDDETDYDGNRQPNYHTEKTRAIRERELGKQEADMGGTSDVLRRVYPPSR